MIRAVDSVKKKKKKAVASEQEKKSCFFGTGRGQSLRWIKKGGTVFFNSGRV
jgi:hypothetical protein